MIINATEKQVKEMMAAAINASIPVGMGIYQHDPSFVAKPENMEIEEGWDKNKRASLDYVNGRMVKFHARQVGENQWDFQENIGTDYQSWARTYNSYQALFDAIKDN